MPNSRYGSGSSFQLFFQAWLEKQQYYLNKLLSLLPSSRNHPQQEVELKTLVGQVLSHHQDYYESKSKVAHQNVFLLFAPPWFSSYERTFLWIAGFKPGLAFKILDKSVGSALTPQQVEKVQTLKMETRAMEKTLGDAMAMIQESVAGPTMMQVVDGEMDQVMETFRGRLRDLVVNADFLRARTVRELVEILSPLQASKFFAIAAQFQLKVRALGLQRDADRISG